MKIGNCLQYIQAKKWEENDERIKSNRFIHNKRKI